jgi:hypothetical protein
MTAVFEPTIARHCGRSAQESREKTLNAQPCASQAVDKTRRLEQNTDPALKRAALGVAQGPM